MPVIDVSVHTDVSTSVRARQVSSMFDVPLTKRHDLTWHIDAPWESREWSVGLIVGPSGSGKTTIARHVFGDPVEFTWSKKSVIDDFSDAYSVQEVAAVCSSVEFSTIPAWLRPFAVLSNGEQFRVTLARTLLESPVDQPLVIDEFTSVVDRQVAKIGSHAVQKWIRTNGRQFVAVTCHYDVIDWLQPDWVLDPAAGTFEWRSVQPRPALDVEIKRVSYDYWNLFAPYHYLTRDLHKGAQCFAAFVDGAPVGFVGVLRMPHPSVKNIMRISRIVVLPDWQGIGLSFALSDTLGAVYKSVGERLRNYPAHPAYVRSIDRSPRWALIVRPGYEGRRGSIIGRTSSIREWHGGGRPCAVFEYTGPAWESRGEAEMFLHEKLAK